MEIDYRINENPDTAQITSLYNSSGIKRPTQDAERIAKMYRHSNLIVTAWDQDQLVGVARSLTDFCYCCYLSDLAVREEYKHRGIGKKLIDLTRENIGSQTTLILLSASNAMGYYPKLGFEKIPNGYIIHRCE
jgi:ribosomal protein S18 acetylase RimI-like enzyme